MADVEGEWDCLGFLAQPYKAFPALKWVGGKTQLIPEITKYIPKEFNTYVEPFMGGGALFFHLWNEGRFKKAVYNDFNSEIINLYEVLRGRPEELMATIDALVEQGFSRDTFNFIRARGYSFTEGCSLEQYQREEVDLAARTLYLNKTCFNGLYRQNKKGEFNSPWGKKTEGVTIYDRNNIMACSEALSLLHCLPMNGDFDSATDYAFDENDVCFLDPPYVPLTETSDFKSYTSDGFDIEDQQRVARAFKRMADRGVIVIASNSDTPIVRELYDGLGEFHSIPARRSINSKGDSRGPVNEALIIANAR